MSANRHLDRYQGLDVRVVADHSPESFDGPFAGMVSLLASARSDWLMCIPCDAVQVPSNLAQRFRQRAVTESADIVVLADEQGIHPTHCLIRTALADDAAKCFASGERAPRRWLRRHRLGYLNGPSPLNINTPERLAEVAAALELEE